ncbi:HAD-IA family hydrolase [Roseivivax sediminis]|uniref:Phosphoglycolate phosphatase n=1 Tax=Roseivivax sediminis TaxID=936889 RepID=A0A1I1ZH05_9RHOB|nr:HAD-IA family hydrolase [Roseivivax sediminis]SFE31011.1 phosphoglycolate phosphatase [Roseivivax sediminis]
MSELRLIVFDVDGTLVDSQGDILAAMGQAFGAAGRPVPTRSEVLGIVGLSLPDAFAALVPEAAPAERSAMVEAYKDAYVDLRRAGGVAQSSPLYPGVRAMLERLHAEPWTLLGVATGKSRRGLDKLLDGHGLRELFVTLQCADDHPSKPHPAMLQAALSETGVAAGRAAMVGDTSFDMEMARASGLRAIGVSWGYHAAARLGAADVVIDEIGALPEALGAVWAAA